MTFCSCAQSYLQKISFGLISTPRQDLSQQLTFLQQSTVLIWRIGLSRYSAPQSNALINTALYWASCRLQWLESPVTAWSPCWLLSVLGPGTWQSLGAQSCIVHKLRWYISGKWTTILELYLTEICNELLFSQCFCLVSTNQSSLSCCLTCTEYWFHEILLLY